MSSKVHVIKHPDFKGRGEPFGNYSKINDHNNLTWEEALQLLKMYSVMRQNSLQRNVVLERGFQCLRERVL